MTTILALDASPIASGSASDALEAAAREASTTGAQVVRVRLYERYVRGQIRATVDELLAADAVIIAAPAYLGRPNAATAALLRALKRASNRRHRRVPHAALLLSSTGSPLISSAFGPLPTLRRALGALGVRTGGSLMLPPVWDSILSRDAALPRVGALGTRLAASIPAPAEDVVFSAPRTRRLVPIGVDA